MTLETKSANGASAPAKRPYTRIDWKCAAGLIAGGRTLEEAAGLLGLPAERVWRHLNRSLRFRHYIRQAVERQRLMAELHLAAAARETVLACSRDPLGLDDESLRWLAAEGGLAGSGARREAERRGEGEDLVQQLAATGERPPNQALRRRIAAEKADMDRFMAAAQVELDAAAALWRAREAAAGAGGGERAAAVANGPERSPAVTNGPERSETVANGPERAAPDTGGPAGSEYDDEPEPVWPPHMPRPSRYGTITDLPPTPDDDAFMPAGLSP